MTGVFSSHFFFEISLTLALVRNLLPQLGSHTSSVDSCQEFLDRILGPHPHTQGSVVWCTSGISVISVHESGQTLRPPRKICFATVRNLSGIFFLCGNLTGHLAGILQAFSNPKIQARKCRGTSEHFRKTIRNSNKYFFPTSFCRHATLTIPFYLQYYFIDLPNITSRNFLNEFGPHFSKSLPSVFLK